MLGVTFDKKMNLGKHSREKSAKAKQRVRLLRLISDRIWGANRDTLLHLYKQYIRPVLETGSVITANAGKSNLQMLQRVQNDALRIALRAPRRTRITDLHEQAKIPLIADRLMVMRDKAIARFGKSENVKALDAQRLFLTGL